MFSYKALTQNLEVICYYFVDSIGCSCPAKYKIKTGQDNFSRSFLRYTKAMDIIMFWVNTVRDSLGCNYLT